MRMDYTEAGRRSSKSAAKRFEFPVDWGIDLQSEHERYLTEKRVGGPVVVMNYPKEIKAFYMRLNDDGRTVAAMDVLVPGSERSSAAANAKSGSTARRAHGGDGLDPRTVVVPRSASIRTVPHAGFGLGFERLIHVHDRYGEHPRRHSIPKGAAQRELLTRPLGRGAGMSRRNDPSMLRSLFRLKSFLVPYRGLLALGILAFLVARIFEAAIPLFLKKGIDTIASGSGEVLIPVLGIIATVIARFLVVTQARILVRRVGLNVAFDLRAQLYAQLQRQGARFFSQFTIGDMMTRAIADISLVQRLISMGSILLVVLVFATVVGFSFMLYLSPRLTALILPPLPFVFFYAWYVSREMGVSSRDVQDRMSDLARTCRRTCPAFGRFRRWCRKRTKSAVSA